MRERTILLGILLFYGLVATALFVGNQVQPLAELAAERAQQVNQLLKVFFGLAAAVLLVVEGVLVFSALRGRLGLRAPEANGSLELLWVLLPTAIVLVIGVYSVRVMRELDHPASDPLVVEVTASQFQWTFHYPEHGVTSRQLHLPLARAAELRLYSKDVVHSFWIPAFGGKVDALPDRQTVLTVLPRRSGSYPALCAEYCGAGHNGMQAAVTVEPRAAFEAWMADQ